MIFGSNCAEFSCVLGISKINYIVIGDFQKINKNQAHIHENSSFLAIFDHLEGSGRHKNQYLLVKMGVPL